MSNRVRQTWQVNNPLIKVIRRWLEPRSTNRDEAFRERTIRATAGIIVVLAALTWVTSILIFKAQWDLISYPTSDTIGLVLSLAAAITVSRGRVLLAGWILVVLGLSEAAGIALITAYNSSLVMPLFMLTVTIAALVLPRNTILPTALLSCIIFSVTGLIQVGAQDSQLISEIFSTVILLMAAGLFLRLLRIEFDLRLADMRGLIKLADEARQEADRANSAKSQFLANMSHELRTPLNAIIGYVEIMLAGMAGTFTEKQTELQGYVHVNAKRLLALINDVLNLAKIESGKLEVVATPASPRKVIGDVVDASQSLAQQKNITLKAVFADDVPEVVLCDVQKVQQIVVNLISNGVKFTSTGGVEVKVGTTNKDNWEVKVIDSGAGMPDDAASYIFEKFRQVDNTVTREQQGTGLGLAIVKSLVDGMDGTIKVETALGKGTTFTLTLPRVNQAAGVGVSNETLVVA